jgi:hypothetical protein
MRPLDPLREEAAMFRVLLWVVAVFLVATAIVLIVRAVS